MRQLALFPWKCLSHIPILGINGIVKGTMAIVDAMSETTRIMKSRYRDDGTLHLHFTRGIKHFPFPLLHKGELQLLTLWI